MRQRERETLELHIIAWTFVIALTTAVVAGVMNAGGVN